MNQRDTEIFAAALARALPKAASSAAARRSASPVRATSKRQTSREK